MNNTNTTQDHVEIEEWINNHGGIPAKVPDTFGELRIDFENGEELEEISWKEFFEIMEAEDLAMEYEKEEIGGDSRPPSKKYDFIKKTRTTSSDVSETEMDDEKIMGNTEETSG